MERRFLRPSKSPVSLMAPTSMSLAVILVMAAGVRSRALAICARADAVLVQVLHDPRTVGFGH